MTTQNKTILRALAGETQPVPPIWMMRQAGRHMKVYRDLVAKYPTFRERSEIPEAALVNRLKPTETAACPSAHAHAHALYVCGHRVTAACGRRSGPRRARIGCSRTRRPNKRCLAKARALARARSSIG